MNRLGLCINSIRTSIKQQWCFLWTKMVPRFSYSVYDPLAHCQQQISDSPPLFAHQMGSLLQKTVRKEHPGLIGNSASSAPSWNPCAGRKQFVLHNSVFPPPAEGFLRCHLGCAVHASSIDSLPHGSPSAGTPRHLLCHRSVSAPLLGVRESNKLKYFFM